ncbi:MAG: hypothetical protein J6P62_10265, partial [Bacteroidales bacterium]|nr:hypothetical protein [Bacteroidales bacterium]
MTQNLKRILLGTGLFLMLAAALPAQTRQETEAFKAAVEADLYGNILPFWSRFAPDTKDGFYGTILTDGTEGPLRPTQRFFNIRQLGMTPEHSFVIPASASKADINCVAYTKPATGECAVHV